MRSTSRKRRKETERSADGSFGGAAFGKTVELPIAVQTLPGEYAVTVSFRLKEDTVWGKRYHEVAFGQGVYEVEAPAKAENRRNLK